MQFMPYVDAVMKRIGLDVNGVEGERMGVQGYFHSEITVDGDGRRSSALSAWLGASVAKARQKHPSVCTGATATKLEFEEGRSRVSGVWIRPVEGGADVLVKADREVIVCSGVIGTPQLLMLSGIGPKAHLSALSIPVVQDLPAVGANLTTHAIVPVMAELPRNHTFHVIETLGILWQFFLYIVYGTGILASNGQHGAVFIHSATLEEKTLDIHPSQDNNEVPDIEILITPLSTLLQQSIPGIPCLTWNAALVQPFTTGNVELLSGTDPKTPPKIILPLLADERNRVRLRKAVRLAMRLADEFSAPETGYTHPAPLALAPGIDLAYLDAVLDKSKSKSDKKKVKRAVPPKKDAWRTVKDVEIDEYVNRLVTGSYDPTSTCRMSLTKKEGVVDQKLRVYGVRNLRIADASVFPKAACASVSSVVYMIGERCAEFVRGEWVERNQY